MSGEGLFSPADGSGYLSSSDWRWDADTNTIIVTACASADQLTDEPYGIIVFSLIKLPDYLIPLNPLKIKAYSDFEMTQLLLSEVKDDDDAYNAMTPGKMDLDMFEPSDYFANA